MDIPITSRWPLAVRRLAYPGEWQTHAFAASMGQAVNVAQILSKGDPQIWAIWDRESETILYEVNESGIVKKEAGGERACPTTAHSS